MFLDPDLLFIFVEITEQKENCEERFVSNLIRYSLCRI